MGILLGLAPAELDALHFDYRDQGLVVMNTAMLIQWRDQGGRTSLDLAQALWKVGLGRIAAIVHPNGVISVIADYTEYIVISLPYTILCQEMLPAMFNVHIIFLEV